MISETAHSGDGAPLTHCFQAISSLTPPPPHVFKQAGSFRAFSLVKLRASTKALMTEMIPFNCKPAASLLGLGRMGGGG